eukprot:TRINITY_DN620_c0_g1_i4.p1 TRINITY_DN620_c0_g1~~TRINITY_DN620_c0_g1_i4.p1  ORF type:complete len:613 (+),score=169.42 TRINITY_DN620_c0_g1_i4:96-1841(+)
MAVQATGAQEIAIKKALEAFRKELMPILQVDMKTYMVNQVKEELGAQMREELRNEMKKLSSKIAKDNSHNADTMKHILTEQVKKIDQTSKNIQSSTMKAIKQPVKTKPGARKSVAAAVVQRQKKNPLSRKPTMAIDDEALKEEETATSQLLHDPRKLELQANELPPTAVVPVLETDGQIAIDQILTHEAFDVVMAVVILVGAIMMGVSLQYGVHDYMGTYDIITCFLFSAELAARFYCYRWNFFKMEGFEWNIFDLCIVSLQLVSVVSQTSSAASGLKSLRGLRGLRAIRSLRVLRALRLLRFVEEFRGVVVSMLASLKSTLGVLSFFTFGLYLFGACIASEVLEQKRQLGEDAVNPMMLQYFGNLSSAMLCLYESVTGGLSWSLAMNIFIEEGDYMMAFAYVVFVAGCLFVLMNVVTAIFTGQAMLSMQDDQDAMIVKDIDMLFQKGELHSGDITWDEFQSMLSVPEMVHLFKALNIDVSEARQLYRLLDTENVGVVDYNEFISGCLRLRGPAKSLELVLLMKDSGLMNAWTEKKLNMLSAELQSVNFGLSVLSQQVQALAPPAEEEMLPQDEALPPPAE